MSLYGINPRVADIFMRSEQLCLALATVQTFFCQKLRSQLHIGYTIVQHGVQQAIISKSSAFIYIPLTPPLLSHYVDFSNTVILLKTTACCHLKSDKTKVIMGLLAIYTGILGLVVRPSMLAYIAKRPTMNTVFYQCR